MEAKHTPGPWHRDATRALLRYGRKYDGDWSDGDIPDDNDADLVAAASELLTALQALMAKICVSCGGDDCRSACYDALLAARAAVAKAKGTA